MASAISPSPVDLEARFRAAIQGYWVTRSKQQKKQTGRGGAVDAGLRSAVVQERLYDVACLTLSANARPASVSHPTPDLSFELFAAAVKSQVARWLALTKAAKKT
jgi:hypothetical protein